MQKLRETIFGADANKFLPLKKTQTEPENESRMIRLCSCPVSETFAALQTTAQGLSSDDAQRNLGKYGPNEMPRAKSLGFWGDIFRRCKSPLVVQLLVIAIISGVMGDIASAFIVGAMVILSVGLSYILDRRSNRAVEALGKRVQSRAIILREGKETEVRISNVVPGDIVLLQAGSIIPADLRLIIAKDFYVSQSSLSGESMAVEKTSDVAVSPDHTIMDLANACFLGSTVTSGAARGVIVNTGAQTIFGAISGRLSERREETSFDIGVRSFTWLMIRFMVVMVCVVFFIVGLT